MQNNTITLAVDVLNNATTVDKVFTRFEEYQNRAVYISDEHSIAERDTLALYRTLPKPSGNFRGVGKSTVKFSKDLSVLGVDGTSQVAPLIIEVSFSIPVGATVATMLEMRQRAVALLDDDSVMVNLNHLLMI